MNRSASKREHSVRQDRSAPNIKSKPKKRVRGPVAVFGYLNDTEKVSFIGMVLASLVVSEIVCIHNHINETVFIVSVFGISLTCVLHLILSYLRLIKPIPQDLYDEWVEGGLIEPTKENVPPTMATMKVIRHIKLERDPLFMALLIVGMIMIVCSVVGSIQLVEPGFAHPLRLALMRDLGVFMGSVLWIIAGVRVWRKYEEPHFLILVGILITATLVTCGVTARLDEPIEVKAIKKFVKRASSSQSAAPAQGIH